MEPSAAELPLPQANAAERKKRWVKLDQPPAVLPWPVLKRSLLEHIFCGMSSNKNKICWRRFYVSTFS